MKSIDKTMSEEIMGLDFKKVDIAKEIEFLKSLDDETLNNLYDVLNKAILCVMDEIDSRPQKPCDNCRM